MTDFDKLICLYCGLSLINNGTDHKRIYRKYTYIHKLMEFDLLKNKGIDFSHNDMHYVGIILQREYHWDLNKEDTKTLLQHNVVKKLPKK